MEIFSNCILKRKSHTTIKFTQDFLDESQFGKTQKFRGSIDITAFNRWLIVN